MKKIIILIFIVIISLFFSKEENIYADSAIGFSAIQLESDGRMMSFYNSQINRNSKNELIKNEFKKYYQAEKWISKWIIPFGWKHEIINDSKKFSFYKSTQKKYENKGTTPITIKIKKEELAMDKLIYTHSASMGTSIGGQLDKIKVGFDAKASSELKYEKVYSIKNESEIQISIDPNTYLTIDMVGEGYYTNGIIKYFSFFTTLHQGTFEIIYIDSLTHIFKKGLL